MAYLLMNNKGNNMTSSSIGDEGNKLNSDKII